MIPSYELKPAARWRRLVCLVYDSLLLAAVIFVAGMLFQLVIPAVSQSQPLRYGLFLFWLSAVYGYFARCWIRSGQTLAMKTWRIRLVTQEGCMLGFRQITYRFLIVLIAALPLLPAVMWAKHNPAEKWVSWLAMIWFAFPYLWAFLDKEKQFLHDRLVGTYLVAVETKA